MTARVSALFRSGVVLAVVLSTPVHATWFYSANSVFQSEAEAVDHPEAITQVVVTPHDAVRPVVCVAYDNSLGKRNTGRVETSVRITTPETTDIFGLPVAPVVREMSLTGAVVESSLLECKVGPDMFAGDVVEFDHRFQGMPTIRTEDGEVKFAAISGVVSDAGEPTVWADVNGFRLPEGNSPSGVVPGGKDGWHHATHSIYQAEEKEESHPKSTTASLVLPDSVSRPKVCVGYSNMAKNKGKGKLEATVSISRADGSVETLKLKKGVSKNSALKCGKVGGIDAGDFVDFEFRFKGMPKLGRYERTIEFADATGVVSTSGEPKFRPDSPPPPEPLPDPGPPNVPEPSSPSTPSPSPSPSPTPSTPPEGDPGAPLSSADYAAAAKLLVNNTRVQLQRPRGDSPSKWLVVGPGTRAIGNTNKLELGTAGVGNSIASAVADYERKMGSLGADGALSSSDQSALRWYSSMSAARGPTAIRRDGSGGYHGEYYRDGQGSNHHGPLPSLKSAVDWLISRGL